MEGTVIFALTPRAGRWNHRFLIPAGSTWSSKTLAEAADRVRAGSGEAGVLSRSRTVAQTTTGRAGEELLILQDDRLPELGAAPRRRLELLLDQWMSELDVIVTLSIDWGRSGADLVIPRDELASWLEQASLVMEGSRPGADRTQHAARRISVVVVAIVLAFLCAISLLAYRMSIPAVPADRGVPMVANGSLAAAGPRTLQTLQEIFAAQGGRQPTAAEIQQKLHSLFLPPSSSKAPSDGTASGLTATGATPEQDVQYLYLTLFGRPTSDDLDSLVEDQAIQEALKKLFPRPDGNFDPLGLLPAGDAMRSRLAAIDALSFHCIGRSLAQIRELGLQHVPREGVYGDFFHDVAVLDRGLFRRTLATAGMPLPRFFTVEDTELAIAIETLFQQESFGRLLPPDVQWTNLDLPTAVALVGNEFAQDSEHLLAQERLQAKQQEFQGDDYGRAAFEHLRELVQACHDAVKSPRSRD